MKTEKLIYIFLTILLVLFLLWFYFLRKAKERSLLSTGSDIVKLIEGYRQKNKRLPGSLTEIGIAEINESTPPIQYEKRDSVNYTLSFSTSIDESKFYYSDSKKWECCYRQIRSK